MEEKNLIVDIHIRKLIHETVSGDKLRMSQVFMNILTNAVKYTNPSGKIDVTLSEDVISENPSVSRFTYEVTDNGIGMSEEFVKNIFDRFTRAVDTRINSVQGTGLGMTIVKQLVDLMQGTIEVKSELDVGSTFTVTVTLPVSKCKEVRLSNKDIQILLLTKNKEQQELIQSVLRNTGAKTVSMVDLPTAEEIMNQGKQNYQIGIVDNEMLEQSQYSIVKEMKQSFHNPFLVVVFMSYKNTQKEQLAREAGADYFIYYPLYSSKLISTVEELLHKKSDTKDTLKEDFSNIHVLIAEDNHLNWKVIHKLLTYYGIEAKHAENGQQAVEMVKNETEAFDLIFMDIQMPVMDGYEATYQIRQLQDSKRANLMIYAMSADTFAEDITKCRESGMDGHIAKPIELERVLEILRHVKNISDVT